MKRESEQLLQTRGIRLILVCYFLSFATVCLWVPWHIQFPNTAPWASDIPDSYGFLWSGPSYPSKFARYEKSRWEYQKTVFHRFMEPYADRDFYQGAFAAFDTSADRVSLYSQLSLLCPGEKTIPKYLTTLKFDYWTLVFDGAPSEPIGYRDRRTYEDLSTMYGVVNLLKLTLELIGLTSITGACLVACYKR